LIEKKTQFEISRCGSRPSVWESPWSTGFSKSDTYFRLHLHSMSCRFTPEYNDYEAELWSSPSSGQGSFHAFTGRKSFHSRMQVTPSDGLNVICSETVTGDGSGANFRIVVLLWKEKEVVENCPLCAWLGLQSLATNICTSTRTAFLNVSMNQPWILSCDVIPGSQVQFLPARIRVWSCRTEAEGYNGAIKCIFFILEFMETIEKIEGYWRLINNELIV